MSETTVEGSFQEGAAPPRMSLRQQVARWSGLLILLGALLAAYVLHNAPGFGTNASLSLLLGVVLGIVFQRGRFCFFCIFRDFIQFRNSAGLFAVLTALAVGSVGYALIFGAFLPNTFTGRLPPDAHIGPVSWVLVAAGVAFGIGMSLSGACISGHLYRLGEGYSRAPFALFGSLVGFGLGFFTWQSVYLGTISSAQVVWLPATLGYGGALALQLAVLTGVGVYLLRFLPPLPAREGSSVTLKAIWDRVILQRWNPLITGGLVGIIGTVAYLRIEPLGVTSQLSSMTRTAMDSAGLLADRLNGLDGFTGCAAVIAQTITDNGWLIGGLVVGSFAVVLLANKFQLSRLTLGGGISAALGGVLMGWGAMLALGCTVGTLLSGISAFALSGWVFGIAVFIGVWLGIRFKLNRW
jgi:hypothetical protein